MSYKPIESDNLAMICDQGTMPSSCPSSSTPPAWSGSLLKSQILLIIILVTLLPSLHMIIIIISVIFCYHYNPCYCHCYWYYCSCYGSYRDIIWSCWGLPTFVSDAWQSATRLFRPWEYQQPLHYTSLLHWFFGTSKHLQIYEIASRPMDFDRLL